MTLFLAVLFAIAPAWAEEANHEMVMAANPYLKAESDTVDSLERLARTAKEMQESLAACAPAKAVMEAVGQARKNARDYILSVQRSYDQSGREVRNLESDAAFDPLEYSSGNISDEVRFASRGLQGRGKPRLSCEKSLQILRGVYSDSINEYSQSEAVMGSILEKLEKDRRQVQSAASAVSGKRLGKSDLQPCAAYKEKLTTLGNSFQDAANNVKAFRDQFHQQGAAAAAKSAKIPAGTYCQTNSI